MALTQEFLRSDPVTSEELSTLLAHLSRSLSLLTPPGKRFTMVGMGGTLTSMAAVRLELATYDPERVHGSVLMRADIEAQLTRYKETTVTDRRGIIGLHPKRADIILAGTAIVLAIQRRLDADHHHHLLSDRGLRHGLLFVRGAGAVTAVPLRSRVTNCL